ncbi:MAG: ATP-binding protein [Alphaproteobacteria bacterium]
MLKSFKIKNFKSILDLTVDFSFAEGKAPNRYKELETLPFLEVGENRVVPTISIYGANASGKTNIIKALVALKDILDENILKRYDPNKLNAKYNSTSFELNFCINKANYTYLLEYDYSQIVKESLIKNDNFIFDIKLSKTDFNALSTEFYDTKKLREIFIVECGDTNQRQIKPFLSIIAKNYSGLNKYINEVFEYIINNLRVYPVNQFPVAMGIDLLVNSGDANNTEEAFAKIVKILRKLDIDITKMTYEKHTIEEYVHSDVDDFTELAKINDNLIANKIYSYHKDISGNDIKFNFNEESEGTRTLTGLLGVFLSALATGSTVFIDELEQSLHPLLLIEVIKLFKDKRYNKNNAQLIFTAHNTDILDDDLMRVSEIAIVKKSLEKGTTINRVVDFEGVRNVLNFRKQYLEGAFSGIPHPYI